MDLALLYKISPRIANLTLTSEPDSFHWSLTQNGIFSVRSHYQALSQVEPQDTNRKLWKIRAPLKVKVFLRYLHRGVLLMKDNLAKRNWQGNRACCFYLHEETIQHLFFYCRFARAVWSFFHCASGIPKPLNASHMFGSWLEGSPTKLQPIALLGAAAVCWSLWLSRNNIVSSGID